MSQMRCPIHDMPDCSPLLNGCTVVIEMHKAVGEGVRLTLLAEADWLDKAWENSADKGYSSQLREGFRLAAGWVRFHADGPPVDEPQIDRKDQS